jgi:hypothetical protein
MAITTISKKNTFSWQLPLSVLTLAYILLAILLAKVFNFSFMTGDVNGYWQDSLNILNPFHSFHVPGYPIMIAIVNRITLGRLSPLIIMGLINYGSYIGSIYLIFRILQAAGSDDNLAILGAYIYGLWPFVGLTYTVFPLADQPAIFLFFLGFYFRIVSRNPFVSSLFWGLAIITHKVMWPFVGLALLFEIIHQKKITKNDLISIAIIALPLFIVWLSGSVYHHSPLWIIANNYNVEFASKSSLPLLDGLIGTFFKRDLVAYLKGVIILIFCLLTLTVLLLTLRFKYTYYYFGAAIATVIFLLFIVLNQHEIWAAVRFSRLLAIPLLLLISYKFITKLSFLQNRVYVYFSLFLLFISQIAYSWYMAKIYY